MEQPYVVNLREAIMNSPQGLSYDDMLVEFKASQVKFIVDDRIPKLIQDGNDFEVWTHDVQFVFASKTFMNKTSYPKKDLFQRHWSELFNRDEFCAAKIFKAIEEVYKTQKPQFNVTPKHLVQEIASVEKIALSVEVLAIAPYWLTEESPKIDGFIAVTKLRDIEH